MPPETSRQPASSSPSARALALATMAAAEGDGLGGDDVLERPALEPGKHRRVDLPGPVGLAEDDAASRPAKGLVVGRRDERAVRHGGGVHAGGDQPGNVRNVRQQRAADLRGDLAEGLEVDGPRVGRRAADDQVRAQVARLATDLLHVDALRLRVHAVAERLVEAPGDVDLHPVGQVPAVVELHAEDLAARLEAGQVHRDVRAGAAVRLDVGVFGSEQLLGAVDAQLLDVVDVLVAAVVALAGVALGVLVGQDRAESDQDGRRDVVLGGDHLQRLGLPPLLGTQQSGNLRVYLLQPIHRRLLFRENPGEWPTVSGAADRSKLCWHGAAPPAGLDGPPLRNAASSRLRPP